MDCKRIAEALHVKEQDPRTLSPLTLAYMGDCVYELAIRTMVVEKGNRPVDQLNRLGSQLAKAPTQCRVMRELTGFLTEEELAVYRRGRNAKSPTMAKNATVSEYRTATGFEALLGYLYLTDQTDRLLAVLQEAFRIERRQHQEQKG